MSKKPKDAVLSILHYSSVPDLELVNSILAGDSRSFAVLVGRYQRRVQSMGYSFFKNTADAEDFVQDVFIKIYSSLSSFRGESQFSTWLMRIAYNTAINSFKRRKESVSLADEAAILDHDWGPEEQHLRSCTVLAVREAVKELPERYAQCVEMYFFYDMTYNEIEEVTDLPVNTIKSHVFRAKKLLKETLEKEV